MTNAPLLHSPLSFVLNPAVLVSSAIAAILQGQLAVILCVVEKAKAQALCLHFMLTAFQDVFYSIPASVCNFPENMPNLSAILPCGKPGAI